MRKDDGREEVCTEMTEDEIVQCDLDRSEVPWGSVELWSEKMKSLTCIVHSKTIMVYSVDLSVCESVHISR